jgi:pantoate--beta-alanine ligase
MILFKKAEDLSKYISQQKKAGDKIGFVPTMGALHPGHLSLIEASKEHNQLTVCSIFVNPTQFNNVEDFNLYPVTIDTDIEKLITAGCDILFLPSNKEIYPLDYITKHYELGQLENILEGHYRPGHFQGVCQVVDSLLTIVQPDNLYLGEKDFQQCKVISKLVSLMGKQDVIAINIEPTFREKDGLAMSSRNLRLTAQQRIVAPAIFEALSLIKEKQNRESLLQLEKQATSHLLEKGFKVDYLRVVDADTLLSTSEINEPKIALVAAYIDDIRLIDNLILK